VLYDCYKNHEENRDTLPTCNMKPNIMLASNVAVNRKYNYTKCRSKIPILFNRAITIKTIQTFD